jgi:hypothetical protein
MIAYVSVHLNYYCSLGNSQQNYHCHALFAYLNHTYLGYKYCVNYDLSLLHFCYDFDLLIIPVICKFFSKVVRYTYFRHLNALSF